MVAVTSATWCLCVCCMSVCVCVCVCVCVSMHSSQVIHREYKYRIYHAHSEFIAFILRVGMVYPAYTILANHIHCTNVP